MPAHPAVGRIADTLVDSVFSSLAGRLDSRGGPVYPLHIGDSWLDPADGCRMEDLTVAAHPGLHRYTPTRGLPRLVHAIAARVAERSGIDTGPENVLVSAGATAGLTAVMHTILDPGDEVLILAPYWPLIRGIVLCAHGVPTPVPILGRVATSDELIEALERARTPRSVAVYLSTPNNPSGGVLPRGWVDGLADWATSRGLWIVSDEVYEDHVFEGEHRPARAAAPERTLAVHSFSKAFGMAGNRCGYVVGPASVLAQVEKATTHTVYCAPHAAQLAALGALGRAGERWLADARERYARAGRRAAGRLGVPPPAGGTFLFLDVAAQLDGSGLFGFLDRCVTNGLLLAPGPSFGPYPSHVRLCFTCSEPAVIERGVEVLARLIGR